MAKDRLSMRKFKEVLRLKFEHELTNQKIAKSCAMSHVTVGKYLTLAEKAGITWPLPDDIDDSQLEQRLYQKVVRPASNKPVMPAMDYLFKELKRKHVTLQLLWYEYKQDYPEGYPLVPIHIRMSNLSLKTGSMGNRWRNRPKSVASLIPISEAHAITTKRRIHHDDPTGVG